MNLRKRSIISFLIFAKGLANDVKNKRADIKNQKRAVKNKEAKYLEQLEEKQALAWQQHLGIWSN